MMDDYKKSKSMIKMFDTLGIDKKGKNSRMQTADRLTNLKDKHPEFQKLVIKSKNQKEN